jgi:hypothetical protein
MSESQQLTQKTVDHLLDGIITRSDEDEKRRHRIVELAKGIKAMDSQSQAYRDAVEAYKMAVAEYQKTLNEFIRALNDLPKEDNHQKS